jgi:LDH2 family malate/lactate/ureidoglycolate dehydrogenase
MPLLAPWGGLEPFVGNNPYAIGFPYKELPIVLDVANTVAARQKIFSYAREGWQLPDGWAMDKDGNPTNDPQEAINGLLMPVGGHKGAGLALMIDIVLGTLAGGAYSRGICANTVTGKPQHIAHLFFVMNPDFYMSREALDANIDQYVKDFRNVRKKADVEKLLLPGELEWIKTQDRLENGIPVSTAITKELNAYADKIGVEHLYDGEEV